MTEPVWITKDVLLFIHDEAILRHGGSAGLRDAGLLESALASPQQVWNYETPEPPMFVLAAAYALAISRNHAFVDGNKRTAHIAAHGFLRLNGVVTNPPVAELAVRMIERLATSEIDRSAYAAYLQCQI